MSAHAPADPRLNRLLAALPPEDWQRWQALLEPVALPLGAVLHDAGQMPAHLVFPGTAIVSLMYGMADGASAELAVVGDDGAVDIALFMGSSPMPTAAVVQCAGHGWRLGAAALRHELTRPGPGGVLPLLLRYTQALYTQMAQTTVCNRHHTLDEQLCRWLLRSLDLLPGPELVMTQELIAGMLGVRREGVTEAAANLQRAGLIRYARGHITVLDRPGLAARSCECHAVVKREYDRLLPPLAAH